MLVVNHLMFIYGLMAKACGFVAVAGSEIVLARMHMNFRAKPNIATTACVQKFDSCKV